MQQQNHSPLSKSTEQANINNSFTIAQVIPALNSGGVERGVVDLAKAIKHEGYNSIVISSGGILTYQLREAGITHINLAVNSKNPITIFCNIAKLANIIKEHKINILHIRSRAPMFSGYFAAKRTGCKLVSTIHGSYSTNLIFQDSIIKKYYNSLIYCADRVIAVSQFVKNLSISNYQNLNHRFFNPEKLQDIAVVHRGVDLKYFNSEAIKKNAIIELIRKWQIPEDKKIIIMPARITGWKGHEFLLNALARVNADFFCVFIGSDHGHQKLRLKLEKKATSLALGGKVKFVGNCKEMATAYALSYLVISASIRPEAFGRIAIEAQASNRLVIATNIGGSLETIIDNSTGFLVEVNNIEALALKIDEALNLPADKYLAITTNARDHIIANFSNDKMYQQTIAIYRNLLDI
jgi:glycosyltransferase involved in cell wall biosynthesis